MSMHQNLATVKVAVIWASLGSLKHSIYFSCKKEPSTRDLMHGGLNQLNRLCTFSQQYLYNSLLMHCLFLQLSGCDRTEDPVSSIFVPFVLRFEAIKKSIYQDSIEKRPSRHYGRCKLAIQQSAWHRVHAITRPVPTPAGNTGPHFTLLSPAPSPKDDK